MKVSELIVKLQKIQEEHGDLDLYSDSESLIFKYESSSRPRPVKLYYQKWEDAKWMENELSEGKIDACEDDLYDLDSTKPIIKGVLI